MAQQFKADYSFVNWIRFVAMLSIVYEHCLDLQPSDKAGQNLNPNVHFVENLSQAHAMPWIVLPMKFGTICFFIISGYLLGKHLSINSSPWSYYKRRLRVVGIPFLIAFGIYFLKHLGVYGLITGKYDISMLTTNFIGLKLWSALFLSPFWFIFSFLVALGLFLSFWRQSNSIYFAFITGSIAVFYGVNIYLDWVEQRHNLAMPAYLFYLWLGVWLSRHEKAVASIQHIPNYLLISAFVISLLVSVAESTYLWNNQSISPFNSLRLSNQLFSVACFCLLLRNDFSAKLRWLKPRTESFGIYLYHLYFVEAFALFSHVLNIMRYRTDFTGFELAWVTVSRWIIVYTATLLFVKAVNQTRFKWIFGN